MPILIFSSENRKRVRYLKKKAFVPWRMLVRAVQSRLEDRTTFLRDCKGVVHVGANNGRERKQYHRLGLNVLWVEPIPEVFNVLSQNIAKYPKQRAIQALLTDVDGSVVELKIAGNRGNSSTILEPAEHFEVWPDITFDQKMRLIGTRLETMFKKHDIDLSLYDALIIDTQGAELLILKGAQDVLPKFKYVQAEATNFEAYVGGPRVEDIVNFLTPLGFDLDKKSLLGLNPNVRGQADLVFVLKS